MWTPKELRSLQVTRMLRSRGLRSRTRCLSVQEFSFLPMRICCEEGMTFWTISRRTIFCKFVNWRQIPKNRREQSKLETNWSDNGLALRTLWKEATFMLKYTIRTISWETDQLERFDVIRYFRGVVKKCALVAVLLWFLFSAGDSMREVRWWRSGDWGRNLQTKQALQTKGIPQKGPGNIQYPART